MPDNASTYAWALTFGKTSAPLSDEQKRETDRLVKEAHHHIKEGRQVSERLQRAAKLYRERLTGHVEDR